MKQNSFYIIIITLFYCFSAAAIEKEMAISLDRATIKKSPSFISRTITVLKYGDLVSIIKEKNSWLYIRFQDKSGWCHISAVSEKDSILDDIGEGEEVAKSKYEDEVTLAGKGFSPQHEEAYKQKNPNHSFRPVDEIERIKISKSQLLQFAKEGGLNENF